MPGCLDWVPGPAGTTDNPTSTSPSTKRNANTRFPNVFAAGDVLTPRPLLPGLCKTARGGIERSNRKQMGSSLRPHGRRDARSAESFPPQVVNAEVPRTVREELRRFFPQEYERLINRLPSAPQVRARNDALYERILLAIVKLSEGDARRLEKASAAARKDFRNVLYWAEAPADQRLSQAERDRLAARLNSEG